MAGGGVRKFFSLGFSPEAQPEARLMLGGGRTGRTRQVAWEVAAWLLAACGIFLRQGLSLPHLGWSIDRLTLGSFLASIVISLAVFPSFMRWVNRKRSKPGLAHVATPFAFGFFLDLTAISLLKIAPHVW
jgi:hypothetical protein